MKICSKCNAEKPKTEFSKLSAVKSGLSGECRSCASVRGAKWRLANKEKLIKYRKENKDRIDEYSREHYKANKERKVYIGRKWCAANRDKISEISRKYREGNKEKMDERFKKWRAANSEKIAENNRNRSARKRNAEGKHTNAEIKSILECQRGMCANCSVKLFKSGNRKYHVDHIMPLALGGSNWASNLQCLCPTCNLRKNAKHPADWAKQQGKLL